MTISNPKATIGLDTSAVATRPLVTSTPLIGSSASVTRLTSGNQAFTASVYLQASANTATLDTTDLTVTIDTQAAAAAIGTLTLTGNAVAAETVTIGAKTYTWRAAVSTTANEVKIGATASDSIDNLIAAVTAGAGSGTVYGSATTANAQATAAAGAGDTMTVTASTAGPSGNTIATTETMTAGSFGAATLSGGLEASAWDGADGDFEGNAYTATAGVHGFLVHCTAGSATIEQGVELLIPITEGGKVLLANDNLIDELYGDVVFTATTGSTSLEITAITS